MKLYEHESADIFSGFGIRVPERILAATPDEAFLAAEKIGLPVVLKAQVLAGGRGLAGGVKTVATAEEAQAVAVDLLGSRIQGIKVRSIMVVRKVDYYRELYLGITIDGFNGRPLVMVSTKGGMNIEEVARQNPANISSLSVRVDRGLFTFEARKLLNAAGFPSRQIPGCADTMVRLYQVFEAYNAMVAEINPLVICTNESLTHWMLAYGTNIVAGVTPGKGGTAVEGVPVFDSVLEAVEKTGAEASVFFVPAPFVLDAFIETVDAGINLIVVVPEHIPVHDVMKMKAYVRKHENRGLFALGPTTAGILTPAEAKMGIMPASLFKPGRIGIISRSGTLSYEMAGILSSAGYGQSTVVGKGADPVALTTLSVILQHFDRDAATDGVVIVGEVGGIQEEEAAKFIADGMHKPVAAYIAGKFAPEGKRMGHAGAIIRGSQGTFASKQQALRDANVTILDSPIDVIDWAQRIS